MPNIRPRSTSNSLNCKPRSLPSSTCRRRVPARRRPRPRSHQRRGRRAVVNAEVHADKARANAIGQLDHSGGADARHRRNASRAVTYGLPFGSNITYGSPGFPPWVASPRQGVQPRPAPTPAPGNPSALRLVSHPTRSYSPGHRLGRVRPLDLQRFAAQYLLSIKAHRTGHLENPNTGQRSASRAATT